MKYKIGDKLFVLIDNKIQEVEIEGFSKAPGGGVQYWIMTEANKESIAMFPEYNRDKYKYDLHRGIHTYYDLVSEENLYPTKSELINKL